MKPKILFCITVYNGREFVPRAIRSAVEISQADAQIDVLVLDDASPEPGWSAELESICLKLGARYYRTPRNLGIPRNVNLGLLCCLEFGYDFVFINNSDVIFPKNLVTQMLLAGTGPGIAATTAWSNNVSIYSLPNSDPDLNLGNQASVDWTSIQLAKIFANKLVDIPAGISFCIMMSAQMVKKVGLTDPCFGRGYCEETDWSLRALGMGLRICLAPGTFVYHQGRGSNLSAGLVSMNATTVPKNEAIIDMRYPDFRKQVDQFYYSGVLGKLHEEATRELILAAAKQYGYVLGFSDIHFQPTAQAQIFVCLPPSNTSVAKVSFKGFTAEFSLGRGSIKEGLTKVFGSAPVRIEVRDAVNLDFDREFPGIECVSKFRYGTRV
jgi:GT2 family glycosyltransferase